MWDSLGTFPPTLSPRALICPHTGETLRPSLPVSPYYSFKELVENVADLIAHRSLGAKGERAWRTRCCRFWSYGTWNRDDPANTLLNKTGLQMTFCYGTLYTAGLPNALFLVPFPCFLFFSCSIWIASLLLRHSYTRQERNYLLT